MEGNGNIGACGGPCAVKPGSVKRYLPLLDWASHYNTSKLSADAIAALVVTIMLIPQSLAYALLAGLPPEAGLYASIVPILLYAAFGTSRVLAVGPVAVVSLMTAAAVGDVVDAGHSDYAAIALTLAALSGGILLLFGFLRLGFVANFLSHPVIAGFITASGIIIAASQLRHLFGIDAYGHNLIELIVSIVKHLPQTNWVTLLLGLVVLIFLFWVRKGLKPALRAVGFSDSAADVMTKAGPVIAVAGSTLAVWALGLEQHGVGVVGEVPRTLPPLTTPLFSIELVRTLLMPALLISIIGFVESISVAQTLAARRRQRIDPNQELIGLGAANIGAAFTGGFPVTGGFSRSVVNYDAGAQTPAAGAFTAVGLAIAALALTPLVYYLPKATLAATIIVAVLSLIDLKVLSRAWHYSIADFLAVLTTILLTLSFGVEIGVLSGVAVSIVMFLYKTSRPHIAEVGLMPGTEHFRNKERHDVLTLPSIVTLRIDESLYFANARYLEDFIYDRIVSDNQIKHLVLMCSAVNEVDMSALESLEVINHRLTDSGISLHLSEVKGPVMDKLEDSHFIEQLTGSVFLSQHDALRALSERDDGTGINSSGNA